MPWFLETNTIPGMTPESLSPLSATAAGMTFAQLCDEMVELAIGCTWKILLFHGTQIEMTECF